MSAPTAAPRRHSSACRGLDGHVHWIPGARLVGFERGGHLLLAVEQPAIRQRVRAHIADMPPSGTF